MTSPLYQEVHRWKAEPYIWGYSDCVIVAADWLVRIGHQDPARDVRGTYDDKMSCERVTRFFTDPLGVTTKGVEGIAGLKRVDAKRPGDVAVVMARGQVLPFAAVWLGECWATKSEENAAMTIKPMFITPLAIWGAEYAP